MSDQTAHIYLTIMRFPPWKWRNPNPAALLSVLAIVCKERFHVPTSDQILSICESVLSYALSISCVRYGDQIIIKKS